MLAISPIVRGEASVLRVTFLNADTEWFIDTTGWTLYVSLGRSRTTIGSLLEVSATADAVSGAQGQITATLTTEQTAALTPNNAMVELSVDTGAGKRVPLMLATVLVQSPEQFRAQYYQTTSPANMLFEDVPTVTQGSAQSPDETVIQSCETHTQEINMSFSTSLDPTFDVGVMVKFSEPSAETVSYINAIAEDITLKHAQVMGI